MNPVPISFDERAIAIDGPHTYWKDGVLHHSGLAPGVSWWGKTAEGRIAALAYMCPCGCETRGCIPVNAGKDGWNWDGNLELPTLTPSIQVLTPCRWHGYLTKGVFTPC